MFQGNFSFIDDQFLPEMPALSFSSSNVKFKDYVWKRPYQVITIYIICICRGVV